jgi:hypothetical protein
VAAAAAAMAARGVSAAAAWHRTHLQRIADAYFAGIVKSGVSTWYEMKEENGVEVK